MLSKDYLMLRSAQRACPRLELGARLEARTASLQLVFWRVGQFPDSLAGRDPSCRRSRVFKQWQTLIDSGMLAPRRNGPRPCAGVTRDTRLDFSYSGTCRAVTRRNR